jgi:hypothetical protein
MNATLWLVIKEKGMNLKPTIKSVHEGDYVAEVEVQLIITDDEWSPYLSLEDAYKLDDVRLALRRGDLKSAARLARVFRLMPVAA